MIEEWKIISKFPKYEVSSLGRIRKISTNKLLYLKKYKCPIGGMVDTPHLGCGATWCVGSSPTWGTKNNYKNIW